MLTLTFVKLGIMVGLFTRNGIIQGTRGGDEPKRSQVYLNLTKMSFRTSGNTHGTLQIKLAPGKAIDIYSYWLKILRESD